MPTTVSTLRADAVRIAHDDVHYDVTGDAALGALLFALDLLEPASIDTTTLRHADRMTLLPALAAARQYGRILQRHADRADRSRPLLPASATIAQAHAWVHAAAGSVPEAERDRFCWRLARRLGAEPWCNGRPAVALANQQFGMFEDAFAQVEAPPAA